MFVVDEIVKHSYINDMIFLIKYRLDKLKRAFIAKMLIYFTKTFANINIYL